MATVLSTTKPVNIRSKVSALVAALVDSFARHESERSTAVHVQTTQSVLTTQTLDECEAVDGERLVTLRVCGELTNRSMHDLAAAAAAAHSDGAHRLALDMADVTRVSLAGVFALHSAARIFAGRTPLNDEDGWSALREMKADGILLDGKHLCLLNVPAGVRTYLQANGVTLPE